MSRRIREKPDNRRTAIANEAARLMQDQGLTDFRLAKEKAIERLGLRSRGGLPSNGEIESALAERNRIFRGDRHELQLHALRTAALEIMASLESFHPCLVGPVLTGHITDHAVIELHLFSDAAEEVGFSLDAMGIQHRSLQRRLKLRRDRIEPFPGFRFYSREFEFTGIVFPVRGRQHAPLSPVDGRPMRRAGTREIRRLVHEKAGGEY